MAGFLYQQFRKPGQNRIPEPALRLALSQHLEQLGDKGFVLPEGMNAKAYIDQWVDKNYLGRFFLADGRPAPRGEHETCARILPSAP